MKKRILSLVLCLCMALTLLPTAALAAAGESDVDITVERNAATATVTASKLEVEGVSWSGDTVTVKVKVKDGNPFAVFAKNAFDIYATVNKKEAKVQRLDDKHIVVTYTFEVAKPLDPNATVTLKAAHTKAELIKKWAQCRDVHFWGELFAKKPSVSAPYATGVLSDGAVTDAVNYLNYVRYSVGLPEVRLDAELQDLAQYGSVLMAACSQMSHTNEKPADMPDDFYDKGYLSTTTSNICSLPMETQALISGLQLYLADETPSTVVQVGHRRWLLNPRLSKVGFGAATGKDGRTYHNVQCFDTSGPDVSYEAIAWPAPGYQAGQPFLDNSPFSASLNPAIYDSKRIDEIQATVTVTDTNGRLHTTTLTKADKNTSGKFFNIITNDGVATGFTVIFRPASFTAFDGVKARAEISGLYKKGSDAPVTLCWETQFFDPERSDAAGTETDNTPDEPTPPPAPVTPEPAPTTAPVTTGAQSGSKSLPKLSQTEIAALIKATPDTLSEAPFETEPSVQAPFAAGKVKTSALQVAADRVTLLRRLAGLPAVELDMALSEQAQHGAVISAANQEINHYPEPPAGMEDSFYETAKAATATSNLHYSGSSGRAITNSIYVLAKAADSFMDDSDSSNVARVGHRRWQLNPTLKKIGFGIAVTESGGWFRQYVAEKVFDTSGSTSDYDFIAWPASGNFPNDLNAFKKDTAWSVTLNPKVYAKPDKNAVTVTLKRVSDGKSWTFSGTDSYIAAGSGKYFNVETSNIGVSNCVIFRPDDVGKYEGVYAVDIAGLTYSTGKSATLHYEVAFFDSNDPKDAAPAAPAIPATGTAYPSTQVVDLDGRKVTFQMYALKDANGNPTNYVKVRDLALALNGTKATFSVDWNGAVNLVDGAAYTANGSENKTPFSGERTYTVPTSPTNVNGSASDLVAITLYDDAGGGYTYYQLRDLGRKLGFNVDWSAAKGVFIETDKPYSGK